MKAIHITVTGKVQGVFFRASAKETAESLNLTGFAQNQPDGTVYIEAEGDEDSLTKFVVWCKQGPARAAVTGVAVEQGLIKKL